MDIFKYMEESPIKADCLMSYEAMAFDGCYYYFLIPCLCKIVKTDKKFNEISCYEMDRKYNCICYDFSEHCFWATSKNCYSKIFKLNCAFKEIDFIKIHSFNCGLNCGEGCGRNYNEATGIVTGLSYNCCENSLLVAFSQCIVELDKKTEHIKVRYKSCDKLITSVLSICPGYIFTAIKNNQQFNYILNSQDKIIKIEPISKCYILKNMIFNPCFKCHKHHKLDDSCEKENCIKKHNQIVIYSLVIKKGCYQYIVKTNIEKSELGYIPYLCNYDICDESCDCCDDKCDNKNACNDVIESIALVETAISHILNAEGEKLQKVIASTNDIDKILCINKEINKTIVNTTHLEHCLYNKLSAVVNCCNCDKTCDIDCHCDFSCETDCGNICNICPESDKPSCNC